MKIRESVKKGSCVLSSLFGTEKSLVPTALVSYLRVLVVET